jgi:prepilin-type N-terminal cleavage/methylation domain-containing protein
LDFGLKRSAFTLIELMAVLAIMSMLVAVAAVSLKGVCRAARIQHAIEQFLAFDHRVREHATLHGTRGTITIDLDKNTVASMSRDTSGRPVTIELPLGGAARIDHVRVGRRAIDYGRATITVTDRGATPTYAARLCGVDGSTRWLLFAGLTGQTTEFNNDTELDKLFAAFSAKRLDAH